MKLRITNHGGYYGDGNSHYWVVTTTLDLDADQVTVERKDTYYGQLADDSGHPNAHRTHDTTQTRAAVWASEEMQREAWAALDPFWSTGEKHPHLRHYRIFGSRHRYLLEGRMTKALELLKGTDCAIPAGSVWYIILPALECLLKIGIDRDAGIFYADSCEDVVVHEPSDAAPTLDYHAKGLYKASAAEIRRQAIEAAKALVW
ncbi:MAG: hypothetical protein GX601_05600 [Anaerolineales bacterium]|nr:hypothetical protein [Anaerolineales bacterium]